MAHVASQVLGTVNASYSANLSACELAKVISDVSAVQSAVGPAFSFFSEVSPDLQMAFVSEMGLPRDKVKGVAKHLQSLCPFPLALAA